MVEKELKGMIGLEIHSYLLTKEKLFCRCRASRERGLKGNIYVCPICSGQPGAKPMLPNESAVKKIIEIGLMLGCKPNILEDKKILVFQRKHYNWPDMPVGYQKTISGAYSIPVAENGNFLGIRIREVHLEEDPAAWNPENGKIDYNRAGAPLVEIVTEPDFKSSSEVEIWLRQLVLTLSYIKALNKDAGIKADVNVNIDGISKRSEIKNVNSVTEIIKAIDYELKRHEKEMPFSEETRRWNSEKNVTELMRSKENQADYRFIPDPDLPCIKITNSEIIKIKNSLPESPVEKLEKLVKKYDINKTDAEVLIKNLEVVLLFEKVIEKIDPKIALPWITVEFLSVLNYNKKTMDDIKINPEHIIELLELVSSNKITPLKAKDILRKFVPVSFSPKSEALNNPIIADESLIEKIVDEVINENKSSVEDYLSGETKALNFIIGKVMQKSNKRADFNTIKKILEKKLVK